MCYKYFRKYISQIFQLLLFCFDVSRYNNETIARRNLILPIRGAIKVSSFDMIALYYTNSAFNTIDQYIFLK